MMKRDSLENRGARVLVVAMLIHEMLRLKKRAFVVLTYVK
jgi:hypothetical protein